MTRSLLARASLMAACVVAYSAMASPIALNGDGFERAPRYVVPLRFEGGRNVLWQLDCDLHGFSSSFYRRRCPARGRQPSEVLAWTGAHPWLQIGPPSPDK